MSTAKLTERRSTLTATADSGSDSSAKKISSGSVRVRTGEVAGEGDGGAELAERSGPRQREPGEDRIA